MHKIRHWHQATLLLLLSFHTSFAQATNAVCDLIASSVSQETSVNYADSLLTAARYAEDVVHWASSSAQPSLCSTRPGTTEDLSKIVQILGSSRTPFAVKGGGHATNQGFSSTPGVLIALSKFSDITYDSTSQTAIIGAGLIWDDVYKALEQHKVTVVGGRLTGVGVPGFGLGGGYSYLANQHGLTLDNIVAYELVSPNGTVAQVTETSDPELFWGLKGGGNNFGIVTRFTMKTYPMDQVWGGFAWYAELYISDVSKAVTQFHATCKDPKASVIAIYHPIDFFIPGWSALYGSVSEILFGQGAQGAVALLTFYDGPSPPPGIFDSFTKIPHLYNDVGTRDYLSLVQSFPTNITYGMRATFETVPMYNITPNIVNVVHNESQFWGAKFSGQASHFFFVEPFLQDHLSHSPFFTNDNAFPTPSAWPPTRDTAYTPYLISFFWNDPALDDTIYEAVRQSYAQIRKALIAEGQPDPDQAPKYPNYSIHDTPVERIFGDNLPRLRELKQRVDPENVMGLAGGWKV